MNDLPTTVLYPEAFNESLPAGFDGAFHWEYLDKVLRPYDGITNCDVDSLVERGQVFLGIETQNVGKDIAGGKERRTRALLDTGLYTQLDIWGKEIPKLWRIRTWLDRSTTCNEGDDCREEIASEVARWIKWANRFMSDPTQRDLRMLQAAWMRANGIARQKFMDFVGNGHF